MGINIKPPSLSKNVLKSKPLLGDPPQTHVHAHSMKLSDSTKERLAKFKGSSEASTPPTYRRPSVPLSASRSPLRHDYGRGMLSGYHSDTYRTPQHYQGSPYSAVGDGPVCSGK